MVKSGMNAAVAQPKVREQGSPVNSNLSSTGIVNGLM